VCECRFVVRKEHGRLFPQIPKTWVRRECEDIRRAVKVAHRSWWAPPADHLSRSLAQHGMPATLFGFVRRVSGGSQLWVSCLSIAVFVLLTAPLEMQRRILNACMTPGKVS
jgi:hypothetical protein